MTEANLDNNHTERLVNGSKVRNSSSMSYEENFEARTQLSIANKGDIKGGPQKTE